MLMEMYMKEIGSMIKQRALVNTLIWMELSMRVNGRKINSMVKVKNNGLMVLCTRVIMFMARSMGGVNSFGQMDQYMKDNLLITILRVRACIAGQMVGLILDNGNLIKCMEKECSLGQMVEGMKVNILKIKSKERALSIGQMEENILESG
jgi:hypothetical protein